MDLSKLTETDISDFVTMRNDFNKHCHTDPHNLKYLLFERSEGHINLNMDMQRHYVWDKKQEQEMWDTLLLNVRIPELHAFMDERVFDFMDGKQRLTCTFKIYDNEIPFYFAHARPELLWLREFVSPSATKIYFSELPEGLKDAIVYDTYFNIAKYEGLNIDEQCMLFHKINNGRKLSAIAKSLSAHFYMRTESTYKLLDYLDDLYYRFAAADQERLEQALIRAIIMYAHPDETFNMDPENLPPYYIEFKYDFDKLHRITQEIITQISRCPNFDDILNCRSWQSIFPFIIWGLQKHPELDRADCTEYCTRIREWSSRNEGNLTRTNIQHRRDFIEDLIAKVKKNFN